MNEETKANLHNQLIRLGDMMGDGLHHESDGKWIPKEYKKVARALGYVPKKDNSKINDRMSQRTEETHCPKCQGKLKQTRSGAKRARCQSCEALFQLLK